MEVLEPAVARLGDLKVEHARVDDLLDVDLAVAGLEDLGAVVKLADQVQQTRLGLVVDLRWVSKGSGWRRTNAAYHVDLVEDDDIGKLDLVDHEVRDGPLILWCYIIATGREQILRIKVVQHGKGINDSDGSVKPSKLFQPASSLAKRESVRSQ